MNKAILVVDLHKKYKSKIESAFDCSNCPMHYENHDFRMRCFVDDYIADTKGKCPLKPIPTKEEIYERIYQAYGLGKNEIYKRIRQEVEDIYDEILGETE